MKVLKPCSVRMPIMSALSGHVVPCYKKQAYASGPQAKIKAYVGTNQTEDAQCKFWLCQPRNTKLSAYPYSKTLSYGQ